MNINLNYEGFEDYLVKRTVLTDWRNGVQYIFKFPNNYGASVIKHDRSYGHEDDLWELAVITFGSCGGWGITYETEITNDVIGYLTDERVQELLYRIKGLERI